MKPVTLAQIHAAVGGQLVGPGATVVTGICADTRILQAGDLFVAIPGERVDGHTFAAEAVAAGASAVLASKEVPVPHVLVDDVVTALGRLASWYVAEFPDLTVVAVTGSSGKTTTKDLLASVLPGPVVAPIGSFNTEVGLPLTVAGVADETRTLVLEMGARGVGHIEYLCSLVPPDISTIVNVGSAHIGEFGGRAQIAQAKGEIFAGLRPGGTAVVNLDDPEVARLSLPAGINKITFGQAEEADVRAVAISQDEFGRCRFDLTWNGSSYPVALRIPGEHMVNNSLAAAGVAVAARVELAEIASRLSTAAEISPHRMDIRLNGDGAVVIDDCYNANPESMAAALKTLAHVASVRGGRSWAVLGEMKELGDSSVAAHDRIGRLAVRLDIDKLIVVGAEAKPMEMGARQEGSWGAEVVWVPSSAAAISAVQAELVAGDIVLVKASRGVALEEVVAAIHGPHSVGEPLP